MLEQFHDQTVSTSGKYNFIFDALYSIEFLFDTIPIKKIL